MTGPKRFTDIKAGLPGISANVLTQRLEALEAAGLVRREELRRMPGVRVYALTPWGEEAEPVIRELGRWAARSPRHDPTRSFSAASLMLSLRTMFDGSRADGFAADIAIDTGAEIFRARVANGALHVVPAERDGAEVVLRASPRNVAAALYSGASLPELEAAGAIAVEGRRELLERFVTLFPLPPKAG